MLYIILLREQTRWKGHRDRKETKEKGKEEKTRKEKGAAKFVDKN